VDVYLIRHTAPDIAAGMCFGRLDVGVLPDVLEAAERLRALLPATVPVVTNDSQRCRRLATLLAGMLDSRLIVEERLREIDFGAWEGRAWKEIPRAQTDVWSRDIWNNSAPEGETYAAMHSRVLAAWETLLLLDAPALVIVGCAGPLRALMTIALELPAEAFVRLHLDYGGIARLCDASGGWKLEFSNR
jgi:alpha-ribazole phosphatase